MKFSLDLTVETQSNWIDAVMADIPSFLQDHADCERKASAMALSLVAKYPDRKAIIPELIATGIEELEHFQQVYKIMSSRGVPLASEIEQDPYIKGLMSLIHSDSQRRFLDRLLLASIIECRGAERFRLISSAMVNDELLKGFYYNLWVSEAKHGHIFVKMALVYFDKEQVYDRLNYLNIEEGKIVKGLKLRPALH